ncbi:cbl-interacting serine threonine-protein kinase 9 [Stylonychia lemnae]|uniref:non-specific serine/threonine protein kinase n=1 Tax=Stylonychia lemnae TaxID=5949 RepID=A0A078AWR5_STYLE|nr:cbl-interacting serine threonine-protein kinase 9 [Stylonychia lemnae]|eukprot:CDW85253.1 cbl-interacting serine threonine-protein kinase 9 [Stylonychia lemnae]
MIDHPNVVKLVEVLGNNTKIFIVLELINGGDLFDKIKEQTTGLSEQQTREYFKQILSAVEYCHKMSVFHRDLKPENILVDDNNQLKISDFGLSSFNPKTTYPNLSNTTCGTLSYISPEILKNEPYDAKFTDIWSLGVILYYMLVGKLPFDSKDMKKQLEKIIIGDFIFPATVHGKPAKKVTKHAKTLIQAILNPNPRKRPSLQSIMRSKWIMEANESSSEDEFNESNQINSLELRLVKQGGEDSKVQEVVPNSLLVPQKSFLHKHSLKKGIVQATQYSSRNLYQNASQQKGTPSPRSILLSDKDKLK